MHQMFDSNWRISPPYALPSTVFGAGNIRRMLSDERTVNTILKMPCSPLSWDCFSTIFGVLTLSDIPVLRNKENKIKKTNMCKYWLYSAWPVNTICEKFVRNFRKLSITTTLQNSEISLYVTILFRVYRNVDAPGAVYIACQLFFGIV